METLRSLVREDMQQVDELIERRLYSEVGLINQLGHYIINSGGKRLRPALVLLSARACGYQGSQHIELAAIIEFIHTATLLHDDVVDASKLRRGHQTANQRWGNEASVLVGDFLYSRAFQMMVDVGSIRIMEVLSDATNVIAEGEVQQLLNRHDPETTQERYLQVIRNKTAKLFEAASQIGAILTDRPPAEEQALANYGLHIGTAFQLIDDVLDYSASADTLGKNIGDDLAEGKPTLPLLYAYWHGSEQQAEQIAEAISQGGLTNIDAISEAIESSGAIAYTAALAQEQVQQAMQALQVLPVSAHRDAMHELAAFAVDRQY
nr:octaprenyl diphosphate synthase [Methylohalomonas lacus]